MSAGKLSYFMIFFCFFLLLFFIGGGGIDKLVKKCLLGLKYTIFIRGVALITCMKHKSVLNRFKPSGKIFLLTVQRRCFFCGSLMLFLS